ncbi:MULTISPECIES: hypothetical protein [unclassified Nostoc]|uniref:hypothetical protein n=1 Tax=unclassified Nostoc TaxID=2593658 RepID=UPI001D87BB6E|nr:hypothetical protein [Nostoc sp. JL23]MBN3875148.1 hypothetical protein [Nostoc sp. JL23]
MADKILATFRIDPDKWESFKALTTSNGSTASAVLLQFVDNCLDANQIPSKSAHASLDNIEALIDKRIEESLAEVRSQLEELRGKSKAR